MDRSAALKILDIQEAMGKQKDFQPLIAEYQMLSAKFQEAAKTFTKEQWDAVFDYLGVLNEIHLRTLEYALKE